MAFTAAVVERGIKGNKRVIQGTYVNTGGSTGGSVTTGLSRCDSFIIEPNGAAVSANAPVTNNTFPLSGGVVTVITTADEDGYWTAEGV